MKLLKELCFTEPQTGAYFIHQLYDTGQSFRIILKNEALGGDYFKAEFAYTEPVMTAIEAQARKRLAQEHQLTILRIMGEVYRDAHGRLRGWWPAKQTFITISED